MDLTQHRPKRARIDSLPAQQPQSAVPPPSFARAPHQLPFAPFPLSQPSALSLFPSSTPRSDALTPNSIPPTAIHSLASPYDPDPYHYDWNSRPSDHLQLSPRSLELPPFLPAHQAPYSHLPNNPPFHTQTQSSTYLHEAPLAPLQPSASAMASNSSPGGRIVVDLTDSPPASPTFHASNPAPETDHDHASHLLALQLQAQFDNEQKQEAQDAKLSQQLALSEAALAEDQYDSDATWDADEDVALALELQYQSELQPQSDLNITLPDKPATKALFSGLLDQNTPQIPRQNIDISSSISALKSYSLHCAGIICSNCGAKLIQTDADISTLLKQWMEQSLPLDGPLQCQRCFAHTCGGCGSRASPHANVQMKAIGNEPQWCCEAARLLTTWLLFSAFSTYKDQAATQLKYSKPLERAKKDNATQQASRQPRGVGYGGRERYCSTSIMPSIGGGTSKGHSAYLQPPKAHNASSLPGPEGFTISHPSYSHYSHSHTAHNTSSFHPSQKNVPSGNQAIPPLVHTTWPSSTNGMSGNPGVLPQSQPLFYHPPMSSMKAPLLSPPYYNHAPKSETESGISHSPLKKLFRSKTRTSNFSEPPKHARYGISPSDLDSSACGVANNTFTAHSQAEENPGNIWGKPNLLPESPAHAVGYGLPPANYSFPSPPATPYQSQQTPASTTLSNPTSTSRFGMGYGVQFSSNAGQGSPVIQTSHQGQTSNGIALHNPTPSHTGSSHSSSSNFPVEDDMDKSYPRGFFRRSRRSEPSRVDLAAKGAEVAHDNLTMHVMELLCRALPNPYYNTSFDVAPPFALFPMVALSSIVDEAAELLRNDSIDDATKRRPLYHSLIGFVSQLTRHHATVDAVLKERPEKSHRAKLLELSNGKVKQSDSVEHVPSIAASMVNLVKQSRVILHHAEVNRGEFVSEEAQEMLLLCHRMVELADEVSVSAFAISQAADGAEMDKPREWEEWQKTNCMQDVPDEEMLQQHHYGKQATSVTQAPRGRMKRLIEEGANLSTSLPPGVFVRYASSRPDVLKVLIIGPKDTPYEGGLFEFDAWCPANYPQEPPKFFFCTTGRGRGRFNPNLYEDGKVCLSLLNTWPGEPWKANESTILQVLVSLQSMVFCDQPYYNEPGFETNGVRDEATRYNNRIQGLTVRLAMLPWLEEQKKTIWGSVVKEHFLRNERQILQVTRKWAGTSSRELRVSEVEGLDRAIQRFKGRFGGKL